MNHKLVSNNLRRPEVKTRVRNCIDNLEDDPQIIEEHEPKLTDKLREAVCKRTETVSIQDVVDEIQELRKEVKETGKV